MPFIRVTRTGQTEAEEQYEVETLLNTNHIATLTRIKDKDDLGCVAQMSLDGATVNVGIKDSYDDVIQLLEAADEVVP